MSYMPLISKDLLRTDFKFAINFGETNICPLVAFVYLCLYLFLEERVALPPTVPKGGF
jgi:hypothetical protein